MRCRVSAVLALVPALLGMANLGQPARNPEWDARHTPARRLALGHGGDERRLPAALNGRVEPVYATAAVTKGTWTPASAGLSADTVHGVYVDPTDPRTLYASAPDGRLFKSTNAGRLWTVTGLQTDYYGGSVSGLAIDPTNPSTVYVIADDRVYRSTDAGVTWEDLWHDEVNEWGFTALKMDPLNPSTLYLAVQSESGVLKSTDSGRTWTSVNGGMDTKNQYPWVLAIDPAKPSVIYAGTRGDYYESDGTVFRSTDGGGSWSESAQGLGPGDVLDLAIDPQATSTLYAVTPKGGVYKSTDGGTAWKKASAGLPERMNSWRATLAFDPENPSILYVTLLRAGVFKSTDGGASWLSLGRGLTSVFLNSVAVAPSSPSRVYVATSGSGIYVSADGGTTWRPTSSGLNTEWIVDLAISPADPSRVYTSLSSWDRNVACLYASTDDGSTWTRKYQWDSSAPWPLVADPGNPDSVWTTRNGALLRTEDAGRSWSRIGGGILGSVYYVAIDPLNSRLVYTCGRAELYKSTDGGSSWARADYGIPWDWRVGPVAVDPVHPSTLYAIASYCYGYKQWGSEVFKSIDGGATWTWASSGLDACGGYLDCLVIDPSNPSILYVTSEYPRLFKSTDGAMNWTPADRGIGEKIVWLLAIAPSNPSTLYAGTDSGLFMTVNGGRYWSLVKGGPSRQVNALLVDRANPFTVHVGFRASGLWKWHLQGGVRQ